jgi:lysophospholipase L1-like esterase
LPHRNTPLLSRKRLWLKKAFFIVLVNIIAFSLLFAVGEFAVRWHLEGGAGAALSSFFARNESAGYHGTNSWLVTDVLLGYKLNPARPGINSLGIRHDEIGKDKPHDLFRVVVLGDSVAWDPTGFVTLLRERFAEVRKGRVEVINAAIPGYTTYQERMLLERDLLAIKPDLVILEYCLNDNHRFLHRLNKSGKRLLTAEAERVLVPEGNGSLAMLLRSSYLLLEIRLHLLAFNFFSKGTFPWDARADFSAAWQDRTWPEIEEHLRAMRDHLTRIDARFAVVAVPFEPQLQQALLDRDKAYTLKPQRKLTEICRRSDLPLLDLYPAFYANRNLVLYRDGIHFSRLGHELAAQQLLRFLEEEQLAMSR